MKFRTRDENGKRAMRGIYGIVSLIIVGMYLYARNNPSVIIGG